MKALLSTIGLAGLAAATGAQAQVGTPATITEVVNCRAQTDDAARLRCFDAAAAALAAASSSGTLVVIDKNEVKRARRGLFGLSLPDVPFLNDDDMDEEDKVKELVTTLRSARGMGYALWVLDLNPGGTWQTIEAQLDVPLPRSGAAVVIRRGPLGNYLMTVDGRRGIRVKRLR